VLFPKRADHFVGSRAKSIITVLKILHDVIAEPTSLPVLHWLSRMNENCFNVI